MTSDPSSADIHRAKSIYRPTELTELNWRPGIPTHWIEQSKSSAVRSWALRIVFLLQLLSSVFYFVVRGRFTLSKPTVLQVTFFVYEIVIALLPLTTIPEWWKQGLRRRSVPFSRVPLESIAPTYGSRKLPFVSVLIPVYRESVSLVAATVRSCLKLDYPTDLLAVHLCDDGRDGRKADLMRRLQKESDYSRNLYYVTRPTNEHAKPGNLNHTLRNLALTGETHYVVQLDADFAISDPQLIHRLLSVYLVYDAASEMYVFDERLAFVQAPQRYRNLSVHDPDWLDLRNTYFFRSSQNGKDSFNGSTMVGTVNLINFSALKEAGFFPYHSLGDDTALSLILHSRGYRSAHVDQHVLATGLVPASLRGALAQRARWFKSDWQILFSSRGPLSCKGLSFAQRVMYANVSVNRLRNVLAGAGIDFVLGIGVLVLGIEIVVVRDGYEALFLAALLNHLLWWGVIGRAIMTIGSPVAGTMKSLAGQEMFEIAFRYGILKGFLQALFRIDAKWKVAEKSDSQLQQKKIIADTDSESENEETVNIDYAENEDKEPTIAKQAPKQLDRSSKNPILPVTAVGAKKPPLPQQRPLMRRVESIEIPMGLDPDSQGISSLSSGSTTTTMVIRSSESISSSASKGEPGYFMKVWNNLRRCWYNVIMAAFLTFTLVFALANISAQSAGQNIQLMLSLGFVAGSLIPHLAILRLCFKDPYLLPGGNTSPTVDHWAKKEESDSESDKMYVPISGITVLAIIRIALMLAAFILTTVYTLAVDNDDEAATVQRLADGVDSGSGQCAAPFKASDASYNVTSFSCRS